MKKENKPEIKNAFPPFKKWIPAFFFLTALLLVLNKVFIKLLSDLVVDPILSRVERSILNDIIFLAAGALMFILVIKKRKSYLPDFKIIVYSIALTIGYCYFRFLDTKTWHFTKSVYFPFAYADLLLLTGLISLWYLFRLRYLKSKKQPEVITNFFNDKPIKKIENDLLSYGHYAKNVAKDINESIFDPAFAIGITSKWGGGKTSFFYMIKEELSQETMKIDFNPWRSINAKSIVKDFFQVIQNELEPYSSKLAALIKNYGEKIIELKDDGTLAKGGKILLDDFKGHDSIEQKYLQINETLRMLNKKIVIFIDDVDRLDKEEVFEVIRLIRNTANFYNCCFIVAYDRSYVLHSLKSIQVHRHEEFLEKIFQLEITLPYFNEQLLIDKFIENLSQILGDKTPEELQYYIKKSKDGKRYYFLEFIKTLRDVNRLSNSIKTNIHNLKKEVDLSDFILIEILRFKYPSVYETLFKNADSFLTLKKEYPQNKEERLVLLKVEDNDKTTTLAKYLTEHKNELELEDFTIAKVVNFVDDIFDDRPRITYNDQLYSVTHLSIQNNEKLKLYFSYGLIAGILSEDDFLTAFDKEDDFIEAKVLEWLDDGKEQKVIGRIETIALEEFNTQARFEKLIHSIFFIARQESRLSQKARLMFNNGLLFRLISPHETFVSSIYQDFDKYKTFVNSIFSKDKRTNYYQAYFLNKQSERLIGKDLTEILNAKEIEDYLLGYLKDRCSTSSILSDDLLHFFSCCNCHPVIKELYPTLNVHKFTQLPKALELFQEFISENDLNGFLSELIFQDSSDPDKFNLRDIITMVFENLSDFDNFLNRQDTSKWPNVDEFKRFKELLDANSGRSISFDFTSIQPRKTSMFHENAI